MPVPRDAFPDEPDGATGEARDAPVVPLPASGDGPRPRPSGRGKKPRRPSRQRNGKPAPPAAVATDPGPPPPLPADLVDASVPRRAPADIHIPPKPPLPAPPRVDLTPSEPDAATPLIEEEAYEPVEAEPDVQPEAEGDVQPDVQPAVQPEEEPGVPAPADLEMADPFAASVVLGDSSETATAALALRGVTKAFGDTRAVDGIDLTVPAGTFYGLVGPNGAGKTTTLSLIAGLLRPDKGAIRVAGVDAASDPVGAKRLMGVLPDRLRTFDRLTGRQLLYYYGVLRGLPAATVESRMGDLARAFDLTDALGRSVSDYSAGMLKKVMLAGALIHSPRLLVLDEPFEAVDPVSSAVILDILSAYVAHGGTVILSSHGMEFVERVCSRVAVMVAGQVLAEGTVEEVRGELTLEQRFIELAGGLSDVEGLEWLHTFSD
ncbi:ABC-2 type transport system ATP-binding protein [Microbacterium sp. BK668]|nr:ABC-2 type transport system ATP-binding protein [Microbacterium sp. BK668]